MLPIWDGPYKLKIKVISAALTKNTDVLTKMDPYAELDMVNGTIVQNVRGPTHKGGHKAPKWDWECDFYFGGEISKEGPLSKQLTQSLKI